MYNHALKHWKKCKEITSIPYPSHKPSLDTFSLSFAALLCRHLIPYLDTNHSVGDAATEINANTVYAHPHPIANRI